MFLGEVLVALLIALVLAFVFVSVGGWRLHGDEDDKQGAAFVRLFVAVFVAAWAGGIVFGPLGGPTLFGIPWLGSLAAGLLVALMLVALTRPSARGGR